MLAEPDKLRPPFKTHGGKSYLCRRIIRLMPEHEYYCEPFVGGGSVFLNKPRAEREYDGEAINDANPFVAAAWEQLKQNPGDLISRLMKTRYSQETFERSKDYFAMTPLPGDRDPMDMAYHWIVCSCMSRGANRSDYSWSERTRGGMPGNVNAWHTLMLELPRIAERVKGVLVFNMKALELLRLCDCKSMLFYLDPPYLPETRTSRDSYGPFEMSFEDHLELLAAVRRCKGKVMLSGYDSHLYDASLKGWRVKRWELANHSGQGKIKNRRTECLWMNF